MSDDFKINHNWKRQFKRAITHNEKPQTPNRSYEIKYKKAGNGRTVKRKIDPVNMRGNLLVAFDHKRGAIRSFKMERVMEMSKVASGFYKRAMRTATGVGHQRDYRTAPATPGTKSFKGPYKNRRS